MLFRSPPDPNCFKSRLQGEPARATASLFSGIARTAALLWRRLPLTPYWALTNVGRVSGSPSSTRIFSRADHGSPAGKRTQLRSRCRRALAAATSETFFEACHCAPAHSHHQRRPSHGPLHRPLHWPCIGHRHPRLSPRLARRRFRVSRARRPLSVYRRDPFLGLAPSRHVYAVTWTFKLRSRNEEIGRAHV